ncbi:V-set and immunoglobulin domain-containing protein 10 isoform X2 [Echeneis naucrates]|nr:V-set and immunoglobulin domain-containing protein 10 isoform X2 [Echeneis naucrates]
MKDGRELLRGWGPPPGRLAVMHDGSLIIRAVAPGDEGQYTCSSTLPGNFTFHGRVLLQVTAGPENVFLSVSPATTSNGTVVVYRGSAVTFNCSGTSYPSQQLTLAFRGSSSSNDSLVSGSGDWLVFTIEDIQPSAQGVYSCRAHNDVSHETVNRSVELLVYYVPDRHPECMWSPTPDPSQIQFNCSWFGAYPTPTLSWEDDPADQGEGRVYAKEVTDSLSVTLNRSVLFDGQMLRCSPRHQAIAPGKETSCWFALKPPYPEGEPLATAVEATNVTLTCTEAVSIPPAFTTWRKGLKQDVIVPGSKYVLSEDGPVCKLTIVNISKDDEGVYFCRSENPLAVRDLEVYLTVKASSEYTGAIIGVFIAVLIVGSAAIIAKTVYSSRHRICLGTDFRRVEEDRGDVLSLVESDDEQIFQDAVPQLPPLSNSFHTTLVQIHRIPSSDHDDAETTAASPEQQEDTAEAEEPVDLVTF